MQISEPHTEVEDIALFRSLYAFTLSVFGLCTLANLAQANHSIQRPLCISPHLLLS